jgi:C1A family cysteine protease
MGLALVAMSGLACNGAKLTGEPLIYGVHPETSAVIDRDVFPQKDGVGQGVIPHKGEIIALVLNNVFLRYVEDISSPHVLVYAEVFDDGTNDPDNALTRILFNGINQPGGVNLGLSDTLIYGPTPFKGLPIRVRFYVLELDREEKELASRIINAAGAVASTAKPEAAPAIAIGVQIAQALNALNEDDYELRFDMTLYPVAATGKSDIGQKYLKEIGEPVQRQGLPVTPVAPLRTGSYVVIKRELEERKGGRVLGLGKGVAHEHLAASLLFDWPQEFFTREYQTGSTRKRLPGSVDNRPSCPPIEDQGALGSCTAQAVVGMMEYMMRRSRVRHVDLSRLFLYKITRRLLGWTGDTGAFLRTTMQAVRAFGVPPEEYWPYRLANFEDEPDAFLYAYADNFSALNFTRLDQYGSSGDDALARVKRVLASGFVSVFGFPVYSSMSDAADIPYPTDEDELSGGHAVLAVGYDDGHMTADGEAVPSLLIRNSWGTGWGDGGYGWLPYYYVEDELTEDFWTIFKQEWIDPTQFS